MRLGCLRDSVPRRRAAVCGLALAALALDQSAGVRASLAAPPQGNAQVVKQPAAIALVPGAELFHGSHAWPFQFDLYVSPQAPQQTATLFYRTTSIPQATAVLWQVTSVPFPPFDSGDVEAARKPPGLVDWGYVHHGKWMEGTLGIDLTDLKPVRRAATTGPPDYFVRILPIAALKTPVIVGTPSNTIRVVRGAVPPSGVKIDAPDPSSPGSAHKYHNGMEPFDLGQVVYVDHPELDRDGDGLRDSLELSLASRFVPVFVFDSAEDHRRPDEPVVLFQVRPKGTVGLTKPPFVEAPRIIIEYVMLFQRDGGYGPSSDCPDAHNGDNQSVRAEITSSDGRWWAFALVSNGRFDWPREISPYEIASGTTPWSGATFENGHPLVFLSAHKHHQYFDTSYDEEDSPYSDYGCNDDVNGNGARVLPSLVSPLPDHRPNNVGEPELFQDPANPHPAAQYFVDALDAFGYPGERAWSTKHFTGGLEDEGGTSDIRHLWKKHAFDFAAGFDQFRPLGRLRGRLTDTQGQPLPDVALYYRPIHPLAVALGLGRGPWSRISLDAQGRYDVSVPESLYLLRPAASDFDFAQGPISVFSKSAAVETTDFVAKPASAGASQPAASSRLPATAKIAIGTALPGAPAPAADSHEAKVQEAIAVVVAGLGGQMLQLDAEPMLVAQDPQAQDGGKDAEDPMVQLVRRFTLRAQLQQARDAGGQLIQDPLTVAFAPPGVPKLTAGVQGAKVRARIMGGPGLLEPEGKLVEATTDASGNARFTLSAGRHPGRTLVRVEVVDNPVQPWAVFSRVTPLIEIQPAIHGDDLAAPVGPTLTASNVVTAAPTLRLSQAPAVNVVAKPVVAQPIPAASGARKQEPRAGVLAVVASMVVTIEMESLLPRITTSAGPVSRQEMAGFGPGWGGNAQVLWRPPPPVDTPMRNWPALTISLDVAAAGTYHGVLHYTRAPDYGNARVFIGGQPRGEITGHAAKVERAKLDLGKLQLFKGSNQLIVTVFGKQPASTGFLVGLDKIELLPAE